MANCKPHYQSIMNYTFMSAGSFSLKDQPWSSAALNPTSLCEADGLGLPPTSHSQMQFLASAPFNFTIEAPNDPDGNGKVGVDWNRDGTISPCTSLVQGVPNSSRIPPGGTLDAASADLRSCEWDRYRTEWQVDRADNLPANQTPAVIHLAAGSVNEHWLLYRALDGGGSSEIRYKKTASDLNNPNLPGCTSRLGHGCAVWTGASVISGSCTRPDPASGPAAAAFYTQDPHVLAVWNVAPAAGCETVSRLRYWRFNRTTWQYTEGWVPGSEGVTHEPSLASFNIAGPGSGVLLLFRKSDGYLWQTRFNVSTMSWDAAAVKSEHYQSGPLLVATSPSLASYRYGSGVQGMRAVLVDPANNEMFWMDWQPSYGAPYKQWWMLTGLSARKTAWKPGLAWVPNAFGQQPGRFFLAWKDLAFQSQYAGASGRTAMVDFTRGDGTAGAPPAVFENKTYLDNEWFAIDGGVNLFLDPALDKNLRMALVFPWPDGPLPNDGPAVMLRPFADGRFPVVLKDNDDFLVMRTGICVALRGCDPARCGQNPLSPGYPCPGSTAPGGVPEQAPPEQCP